MIRVLKKKGICPNPSSTEVIHQSELKLRDMENKKMLNTVDFVLCFTNTHESRVSPINGKNQRLYGA